LEEGREGFAGFSPEQEKRDVVPRQSGGSFFEAPEEEIILTKRRLEKPGHQIEDHGQGDTMIQSQLLGVEQGPIIPAALVPAEPVEDRTTLIGVVVQGAVALGERYHKLLGFPFTQPGKGQQAA
jgi:hypothetical protein